MSATKGRDSDGLQLYGEHEESKWKCSGTIPSQHASASFSYTDARMYGWTTMEHNTNNLEHTLCQWLEKDAKDFTPDQQSGMRSLRSLLKDNVAPKPVHLVAALDAVFFGGLLSYPAQLRKREPDRLTVSVEEMAEPQGDTSWLHDTVPRQPHVKIVVHNFLGKDDREYKNRPEARRLEIVATLIHEMIHAFILIYGCSGRQCATKEAVINGRGFDGHGPCWEKVAAAATKVFLRNIVPILPDAGYDHEDPLGIAGSVQHEKELVEDLFSEWLCVNETRLKQQWLGIEVPRR